MILIIFKKLIMMRTNEELKPIEQEQSTDFSVQSPTYYGNMITLFPDQHGKPRFMLGPHYPLFFTAFICCSALVFFVIYNYFDKFTLFWKIITTLAGLGFVISYLKIGFSDPGIARPKRQADSRMRQEYRFCHVCGLLRDRKTQHCMDCNICIEGFDHHCPWIGKCVGTNNLSAFYTFLVMTFGFIIICFISTATVSLTKKNLKHD